MRRLRRRDFNKSFNEIQDAEKAKKFTDFVDLVK